MRYPVDKEMLRREVFSCMERNNIKTLSRFAMAMDMTPDLLFHTLKGRSKPSQILLDALGLEWKLVKKEEL